MQIDVSCQHGRHKTVFWQQRRLSVLLCGVVCPPGNGFCDRDNNNEECAYDGGDCCSCTCDSPFGCFDFACVDPSAECVNDDDVTVDIFDNCPFIFSVGNGFCDPDINIPECSEFRPALTRRCRLFDGFSALWSASFSAGASGSRAVRETEARSYSSTFVGLGTWMFIPARRSLLAGGASIHYPLRRIARDQQLPQQTLCGCMPVSYTHLTLPTICSV